MAKLTHKLRDPELPYNLFKHERLDWKRMSYYEQDQWRAIRLPPKPGAPQCLSLHDITLTSR